RTGKSLPNRILNQPDNTIFSLVHFDLNAIVAYVKKSSLRMMAMGYLPYLEKLSSLSLSSGFTTNIASSDLVLRLK
ncbi:MAG TPA: hypothetical protein PKD85_20930, partial [Saprospiraceae bacterium]|nr:hypothetical protein [Saprospiraceae bacterium]